MPQFKKLQLKIAEKDGKIYSIAELKDYIDFEAKRFYFVQGSTGPTGQHCHFEEKELFVMVRGKCVAVIDQGNGKEEIPFHSPKDVLYVGNYIWHGFKNFSEDAVLLAISSTNYRPDRSDYLEDYSRYLTMRDEKLKA